MKHFWFKAGAAAVGLGIIGGVGAILFMGYFPQDVPAEISDVRGEAINVVRTLDAPAGTLSTETNDAYTVAVTTPSAAPGATITDSRTMALVPRPSAVRSTIRARQTCFCGALRSLTTAVRRA